jgi:hypothetical protein
MDGFAYVAYRCANAKGTSFVDVSDPARPTVVYVTEPMSGTFADDVWGLPNLSTASFQGDLLVEPHDYCRRDVAAATRFWDVTDPRQPVLLSTLVTGDGVHNVYAFTRIEGGQQKAYVILAAPNADLRDNTQYGYEDRDLDADFVIVDASDPRNPTIVGRWNAHDTWSDLPRSTFQHDTWANKAGTMAYGAYWDAGMIILDITDIANPRPISRTGYSDVAAGNTHGVVLSKDERYAVVTDEDFSPITTEFRVLTPPSLAGRKPSSGTSAFSLSTVEGELVWAGRGCDADPAYNLTQPDPYLNDVTGKVAVVLRGGCSFAGKVEEAQKHGAIGTVVVNDVAGGAASPLGGSPRPGTTIAAIGISYEDGNAITTTTQAGTPVTARFGGRADEWGYTRIFDISNPEVPRQVAEYVIPETRADPPAMTGPQGFGYSVHNAYVDGDKVYIAHYDGGVRVLDISDPRRPVETGYLLAANGTDANGQPATSSIWGIITDERGYIYASDIIGGLWVLRESAQPTATPPAEPTTAPPTPTSPPPTATPLPEHVCPQIVNVVPPAAIAAALANPAAVGGYNQPLNPARPAGPGNPLRTWLSIYHTGVPYHPIFNPLVYRAGCP